MEVGVDVPEGMIAPDVLHLLMLDITSVISVLFPKLSHWQCKCTSYTHPIHSVSSDDPIESFFVWVSLTVTLRVSIARDLKQENFSRFAMQLTTVEARCAVRTLARHRAPSFQ
jgi:hypothetical protein